MHTNWIQTARQKLAASAPQDDKAVTEAFAQQAYTAIGNRDKEIMRDPYMLGFEIVTKNEENTRLVGVFAFRVSGEILLAPVFYLNGQIKGQDLLYRKGVNRFIPNTDKWVSYLMSRGEDGEGRAVDRRALDARIHLDLRQLAGSRINKYGSDCSCKCGKPDCDCEKPEASAEYDPATRIVTVLPDDATAAEKAEWEERGFFRRKNEVQRKAASVDIKQLWKEAMDAWTVTEPQLLFADFLVTSGMQKQAAELAEKLPVWAELLEVAGSLKQAEDQAVAASPVAEKETNSELEPADELVKDVPPATTPETAAVTPATAKKAVALYTEPQAGWTEGQLEEFYKQGFALRDSRDMEYLSTAFVRSDMSQEWSTLVEPGVRQAVNLEGDTVKCLWTPLLTNLDYPSACVGGNDAVGSAYRNDRELGCDYALIMLEGKDKGTVLEFRSGTPAADIPVFKADTEPLPDDQQIKGRKPVAGGVYAVWIPKLQKALGIPLIVKTIKSSDGRQIINAGSSPLIINSDIDTNEADLNPSGTLPRVIGGDAVFIPLTAKCEYGTGQAEKPENIVWATPEKPSSFQPLLVGRLDEALLKTKTARVEIRPCGHGRVDVLLNGQRRAEELNTPELVWKLAAGLSLPAEEAIGLAFKARDGVVKFEVMSPAQKQKYAASYYDRYINPETDFQDYDYDQDFQVPIHRPEDNRAEAQAVRYQQVSPQRRYLDAQGNSGPRNRPYQPPTSIPDAEILQMQNPLEEMMQIGSQLGLKSLLDHGAVGSLTKVFDATPFINQYVDKLENSLDYLARLLFMLFWKPKDFADTFGSDDLPNLENKLIGVFISYGDLVLELRQSAGEDKN